MSNEGIQVYVVCASDAYSYVSSYMPIAVFANEHEAQMWANEYEDDSKRADEPMECCVFSSKWMG